MNIKRYEGQGPQHYYVHIMIVMLHYYKPVKRNL